MRHLRHRQAHLARRKQKEFGADLVLNVSESTAAERTDLVRSLTHGRGADIVVECVGQAHVLVEGLEMLRKGGTYIEAGNFVETGDVALSPHRHFCAKNVRLIGMTNHPFIGYTPSMQMMQRTARLFPYERFVTHVYPLAQAEQALLRSMEPDTMKVVLAPWAAE